MVPISYVDLISLLGFTTTGEAPLHDDESRQPLIEQDKSLRLASPTNLKTNGGDALLSQSFQNSYPDSPQSLAPTGMGTYSIFPSFLIQHSLVSSIRVRRICTSPRWGVH